MKIVFVHGRAQEGRKQKELQSEWKSALLDGFRLAGAVEPHAVDVALPFYGDELFKLTNEASKKSFKDLVDRGAAASGPSPQEQKFFQDVVKEMLASKGISAARVAEEVDGGVKERDIQNWKAVLAALRLLERVPGVSEASIERWTRDVWLYLTDKGIRAKVDLIVEADIPKNDPCVVVAHSLGSIVAYSILMGRADRSNVVAFITLGSPLGVPAILDRLPPDGSKRVAPNGAGRWFNARDKDDVVALHEIPTAKYRGKPVVENFSGVNNSSHNQHGIVEYLEDKTVARAIYDAFRGVQPARVEPAPKADTAEKPLSVGRAPRKTKPKP